MDGKNKRVEAYSSVCGKALKLCPRLVPSPLWGLNLAKLARMEPRIASVMSDSYPPLVERVSEYWKSLNRSGVCEVCGSEGWEIDEDWLYFVFNVRGKPVSITRYVKLMKRPKEEIKFEKFKGVAHLRGLRLLCVNCHIAKHQGYALIHGRGREALEQLQKVNGLGSFDETKQLVGQAFDIYRLLSYIKRWKIEVGELKGLEKETRRSVQELLNHMYVSGFSLEGNWLYYSSPSENKAEKARQEALTILAEVRKKADQGHDGDETWVRHLVEMMKVRFEAEGISVSENGLALLLRLLLDRLKKSSHFEEMFVWCSGGKWIVRVPNALYERIFRRVLEVLEKSELAYHAKILCGRGSIAATYLPIIVYAPTSFAPSYISAVAKVLGRILNEFGLIGRKIYYKPDVFTEEGIYSERGRRASIYDYSY